MKSKIHRYKKMYGITLADYDAMLLAQGGACAICGTSKANHANDYSLYVDHDHEIGRVRGLLCNPCNTALGKFRDNPDLLRRAAEYVEKHSTLYHGHPVGVTE